MLIRKHVPTASLSGLPRQNPMIVLGPQPAGLARRQPDGCGLRRRDCARAAPGATRKRKGIFAKKRL